SNAQFMLSALNYQPSTSSWELHKLNRRAIGIANVNDAFASVRTRPKSLRFTRSFPTRRVDRAQNRVEIIDDERDVHEANIAGPQIAIPLTLARREIFEQFDLMTARCFDDCKLDLCTLDSSDFTGHFASLMRGM